MIYTMILHRRNLLKGPCMPNTVSVLQSRSGFWEHSSQGTTDVHLGEVTEALHGRRGVNKDPVSGETCA